MIFIGVVRGESRGRKVLRLEYEAHDVLAQEVIGKMIDEVKDKYGIIDAIVEHRIGRADVGEDVIYVIVSSSHRKEGFRALIELVNRIKREAPIWKKEVTDEGSRWIENS